jgi:hypothetical protein
MQACRKVTKHLSEIHSAPAALWPALVCAFLDVEQAGALSWTVEVTKERVGLVGKAGDNGMGDTAPSMVEPSSVPASRRPPPAPKTTCPLAYGRRPGASEVGPGGRFAVNAARPRAITMPRHCRPAGRRGPAPVVAFPLLPPARADRALPRQPLSLPRQHARSAHADRWAVEGAGAVLEPRKGRGQGSTRSGGCDAETDQAAVIPGCRFPQAD